MMTRIAAWLAVALVAYLAYDFIHNWQNPWTVRPAVTSVMPAMPDGCRNKAECL